MQLSITHWLELPIQVGHLTQETTPLLCFCCSGQFSPLVVAIFPRHQGLLLPSSWLSLQMLDASGLQGAHLTLMFFWISIFKRLLLSFSIDQIECICELFYFYGYQCVLLVKVSLLSVFRFLSITTGQILNNLTCCKLA